MAENVLTRKVGPLPGWGWLAAVAVGVIIYYRHANAAAAGATGSLSADPNAVDPNTGLTYGQEESAALGLDGSGFGASSLTPTTGSTTDTGATCPVDLTGGFLQQLVGFEEIQSALKSLYPGAPPPPAKHVKTKRTGGKGKPKKSSKHRAPAHPNENTNHNSHDHTRPAPAHTRVRGRVGSPARAQRHGRAQHVFGTVGATTSAQNAAAGTTATAASARAKSRRQGRRNRRRNR